MPILVLSVLAAVQPYHPSWSASSQPLLSRPATTQPVKKTVPPQNPLSTVGSWSVIASAAWQRRLSLGGYSVVDGMGHIASVSDYRDPAKGKLFLSVSIEVTNHGREPSITPKFAILDNSGARYSACQFNNRSYEPSSLNPNESRTCSDIWELPPGQQYAVVISSDKEEIVIDLGEIPLPKPDSPKRTVRQRQ